MRIVRYYPRALTGDGGMTRAVRRSSESLAACGVRSVIAYHGPAEQPTEPRGVQWVQVPHYHRFGLELPAGLADVLHGADLLVLHSAWTGYNIAAGRVAHRLGVPYVLEPRGAYDPHILRRRAAAKRVWWWAGERQLVQQARAVHVFFDAERPHLAALGHRGSVIVSANGVDAPDLPLWDGGRGDPVMWLGRFDPQHKGLDLLLQALAMLPSRSRPRVRLHGPDFHGGKQRVRSMVHDLRLGDHVEIGAPVHGAAKWQALRGASGFVYPSRWEAFGNSAAEAAVLGVPMALTPYPLARHLADRGGAVLGGWQPHSLAAALEQVSDEGSAGLGRRAAAVARQDFSWDAAAGSWLRQVEAVL